MTSAQAKSKAFGSIKVSTLAYSVLSIILLIILVRPQWIAPYDPQLLEVKNRLQPPSIQHFFGTDEGGRDIFSRVIYGARISLGSSLTIVAIAALAGTVIGATSGWVGGQLDRLLMRVVDVFLSFPYLVLAMALAASIGRDLRSTLLALILVWWPGYARLARGQVLTIKRELFISAAKTLGASGFHILFRHVIPHTVSPVLVRATLDVGYVLIALTGLSFLGLGAQNPSAEWGLMVSNAKAYVLSAWWYGFFPGLIILISVAVFVSAGDRLNRRT